jgi:hypothetical protein
MDAWQAHIETMGADVSAILLEVAQWGADAELEACCEWVKSKQTYWAHDELRAARRPKPPSKQEALDELHISFDRGYLKEGAADTIRRALEALPE